MATFDIVVVAARSDTIDDEGSDGFYRWEASWCHDVFRNVFVEVLKEDGRRILRKVGRA